MYRTTIRAKDKLPQEWAILGKPKDEEQQYKEIFGCDSAFLSFRYLGVSIHYRRLRNSE